jgi:hypothetical protein
MEFFNNKVNNILKFKINSEGVDVNNMEPRLIFESDKNNNYIFYGKVTEGVCTFELPELKLYEKGDSGKVKFEIISDELYFPVWKEEFEIKSQVNITLEKLVDEVQKQDKPKITTEYVKEEVRKEPKKEYANIPTSKPKNSVVIKEEKEIKEESKIEKQAKTDKSGIRKFNDFL